MYLNRKYQVGGVVFTPYLPARAGSPQQSLTSAAGSTSGSKSSGSSEDQIKKEIINVLKEKGIPSDVNEFLIKTNTLLNNSSHLSDSKLFGGTEDYDMTDLIKVLSLANEVQFNKKLYDNAATNLKEENAWAEVAVDDRGNLYVVGEDGLKQITPSEYYKNKDKYAPITNSDLLSYRENNKAFDNNLLNDLSNAIGMESISKYVREIISQFGKETVEGYARKDKDAILSGYSYLMENGPDGYYKAKTSTDLRNVNRALDYIYQSLPTNMRNFLRAKTAADGGNPDTQYRDLIVRALLEHTSMEASATWDKTATEELYGKSKGSSGDDSEKNLKAYSYVERMASGQNSGLPEAFRITYKGSTVDLGIIGWNEGPIVKNEQEDPFGPGMLDYIREHAHGFNQFATQGNVQFGDQVFNKDAQSTIYYDGSTVYRVKMPSIRDINGNIMVDWEAVHTIEDVNEKIKSGSYTLDMARQFLRERDPRLYINRDGEITSSETSWFVSFDGIVANNYENNLNVDSPYVEKVSDSEKKRLKEKYENAQEFGYLNPGGDAKSRVGRYQKQGHVIIDWKNHDLYRSKVFMPITRIMAGSTEYYSANDHMDNTNQAIARQKQAQVQKEIDMGIRKTNFSNGN